MPHQRRAATDTGEEVVYGASSDCNARRSATIWQHLYRDVIVNTTLLQSLHLYRYFIFTSFWAYKIYYVYGFTLLVFLILCTVVVCVTIVLLGGLALVIALVAGGWLLLGPGQPAAFGGPPRSSRALGRRW